MSADRSTVMEWVQRTLNEVPTELIRRAYMANPGEWSEVTVRAEDDAEPDDILPMWGSMRNGLSDHWMEHDDGEGIAILSRCGFRVYDGGSLGYWFGIDGGGYDFCEAHWRPLYEAIFGNA